MSPREAYDRIRRNEVTRHYAHDTASDMLTKAMAIGIFLLVWHAVEEHHPISGTQLAALIVAMSAAFGKSTFRFWLSRYAMKQETTDVTAEAHERLEAKIDETQRVITERRDPSAGFEATP